MAQNKFSTQNPGTNDPQNTSQDDALYDSYQSIDPQFNPEDVSRINQDPNFIESVGNEYNSMMNELGKDSSGNNQNSNRGRPDYGNNN